MVSFEEIEPQMEAPAPGLSFNIGWDFDSSPGHLTPDQMLFFNGH